MTLIFDHYLFFTFRSKSIGFFRNQKSRIYWNTTLKGITIELNYIYFLFLSHREEFDFIEKLVTLTTSLLFVCYCCARFTIGKLGIVENKEILFTLFTLLYILSILNLLYWGLSPPAVHLVAEVRLKGLTPNFFTILYPAVTPVLWLQLCALRFQDTDLLRN